ncbi:MAG: threonylcarbamoyl-AMP synthase [Bacteroidales bacterium]|nr:threonylcarbamoyl-AMP synthase [Bacteroidales bacterium]
MLIRIHPETPARRQIFQIVDILREGGVIIYPTDTVYGIGCDIFNQKAVERVARIKGIKPENANFSFICYDLSHISDFTRHFDNHIFKMMKKYLPGPFTFILPANNNIPKLFKNKKKTVGIRIPKHNIPLEIVKELGNPLLTTSLHDSDTLLDYTTDPELIQENLGYLVDAVIDGGYGHNTPSTILDCTGNEITILRQGLGIFEE